MGIEPPRQLFRLGHPGRPLLLHQGEQVAHDQVHIDQVQAPIVQNAVVDNDVARDIVGRLPCTALLVLNAR